MCGALLLGSAHSLRRVHCLAGCVETGLTLSGLSADKRGQLWRYLRDLMPLHPELPEVEQ